MPNRGAHAADRASSLRSRRAGCAGTGLAGRRSRRGRPRGAGRRRGRRGNSPLGEELRDVFQRIIRLSGERVPLGRLADLASARRSDPPARARLSGLRFSVRRSGTSRRKRDGVQGSSSPPPNRRRLRGPGQVQPLPRARHADVAQPALLFERRAGVERAAVREQPLFQPGDEDDREFQALGVVHGQQRHCARSSRPSASETSAAWSRNSAIAFAALGRLGGGVHQFVQVLQPRFGLRRGIGFEHLAVAGLLQDRAQHLVRRTCLRPRRAAPRSASGTRPAPPRRARRDACSSSIRAMALHTAQVVVQRKALDLLDGGLADARAPAC